MFTVADARKYEETDNRISIQSSLKSHSLWVTLCSQSISIDLDDDLVGRLLSVSLAKHDDF